MPFDLSTLLVSLGVLAVARPARGRLRVGLDRLFFRTHGHSLEVVEALGRSLARTLDAREINAQVQRALAQTMAPATGVVLTHADPPGTFYATDPSMADLVIEPRQLDSLSAGQPTPMPPAQLALPLRSETQLEGLLLLGPKASGAAYTARELDLLRILASHAATALRNATSYRRVTELLSSLEARVDARTRELHQTQAELQASNEKLREIDRLKTQFFSEVSHELRTPLTLVLGPLEQLRQQAKSWAPEARRLIDLAHSSSAKLMVLTDTLLDLSRLDAGRMQPVLRAEALGPLLERTAEPFQWLAEQRGVALRVGQADASATVPCDATMVSKIIGNLLANALKFTSHGSIDVAVESDAERVAIRITDTGLGIPPAELPHIFERYRQASTASASATSGSGLGLALVRELTELHGGTVDVSSEVGCGTTFRVWLPSTQPAPDDNRNQTGIPSAHLAALAAAGQPTGREPCTSIATNTAPAALLIDDNPGLLDFLVGLLAAEYRLHTAGNVSDALALARKERPEIIVCDVMMPGPDGIGFCQALKRDVELRHIPVILLTARASLESKLSGLDAGADDYITKPFHPDELKARMAGLRRVRQMERELSTAQAQLIQAEKMASLGTLVAGVAHEINNPVSFITSSIDLISTSVAELRQILDRHLRASGASDPALARLRTDLDHEYRMQMLQENAAICRDGARRAARIVTDLRTFCRPGSGRHEPVDLHACLDRSLRLLQGECKGRITIHRAYGAIPQVVCDQDQLSQVFVNLLANAIQAIEGNGEVFVRTRGGNGTVAVEIEDTGHGIDAAACARVFDPFFTTKDVGKGTGLGLSIVRSLVTAHGGDITVRSTVGHGSVFTVSLPVHGGHHE